jgi:hypothetical protein
LSASWASTHLNKPPQKILVKNGQLILNFNRSRRMNTCGTLFVMSRQCEIALERGMEA